MKPIRPLRRLVTAAGLLALTGTPAWADTVRIDFGPSDGANGNPTANPDSRGHYWNNFTSAFNVATGAAISNLITADNKPTSIGLTTSAGWKSNGLQNGGLKAPNATLLGDFAIATATQDYFYVEGPVGTSGTLTISGLDPAKYYNLRMFGTRETTDVRKTTYTATGSNGVFESTLQTSGTDIGSDVVYDGNDNRIIALSGVKPDASGVITMKLTVAASTFAYLGALEITDVPDPATTSKTVRIDLGRNDVANGNITTSPDSFGNYWNNFIGDALKVGSSVTNLVTTDNTPTSLSLATSSSWSSNGIQNGGLKTPSEARLGQLAVPTATQDYFYIEGASAIGTFKLSGLNPARLYNLRMFGTRETTDVRKSTYTITAGNGTFSDTLQTSGPGVGNGTGGADGTDVYNGNNRNVITLSGIQADSSGQVSLQVSVAAGTFAYLGILEIVEGATVDPLPPPAQPPVAISDLVTRWVSQDALDPVAPGPVVFVGSSSIRRWESLTRDFADYRVIQRGFGGSQFSDLNPIINSIVVPYQPSAIVVWEGTNDIRVSHKSGATVLNDFKTFVNSVRAQVPNVPICYLGITPCPSFYYTSGDDAQRRIANSSIASYCSSDPNLHYIDTASFLEVLHDAGTAEGTAAWNSYFVDDTHLNRAGYAKWLGIVRPAILSVLTPNKVFTPNPATLADGEKLLFDFGPSDFTNGDETLGADANGNKWNNWHPTNGGGLINSGEHLANLVRTTGTGTGIRMTITAGFQAGGKASGAGLLAPKPALLGDLAVEKATEDYWYSTANDINDSTNDDLPGGFMLDGLNPDMSYEFRFLGSRDTSETRVTEFRIFGASQQTVTLKTSGAAIGSTGGNANDNSLAIVSGVRPDQFGQVFVDLTLLQGTQTHLNAMEIVASVSKTAYQTWRSGFFTAAELADASLEASLWGNNADPDGDGRPNLLEYATGTNPRSADAGSSEAVSVSSQAGEKFITLTYQKNLAATDMSWQVEGSENLTDWASVADSLVSTAGQIETRQASLGMAGFSRRMLRLKVQSASGN